MTFARRNVNASRFSSTDNFGDTSLNRMRAGQIATLPPVPSTLADLGVGGSDMRQTSLEPKGLLIADDATIAIIASLVAASFCDPNYIPSDRVSAIRYININNVDHPASKHLRESNLWQGHRRTIGIPDMVERSKADFVQLFIDRGMPLEPRELECLRDGITSRSHFHTSEGSDRSLHVCNAIHCCLGNCSKFAGCKIGRGITKN